MTAAGDRLTFYAMLGASLSETHGADWSGSLPGEPPTCTCGYNGTPEDCATNRIALGEQP